MSTFYSRVGMKQPNSNLTMSIHPHGYVHPTHVHSSIYPEFRSLVWTETSGKYEGPYQGSNIRACCSSLNVAITCRPAPTQLCIFYWALVNSIFISILLEALIKTKYVTLNTIYWSNFHLPQHSQYINFITLVLLLLHITFYFHSTIFNK